MRYAETNGYERDGDKPNAWRYRDYVIDALNHDKPYDRFVTEQLAGDELRRSDAETQIATTFLRLGTWDDEPAEPHVDRYDQLDDVLGTAATAFLGITLRCARCHDHKFEPFSQVDYYRMLAVFEPLKRPQNGRTELDRPVGTEAELAAYQRASPGTMPSSPQIWDESKGSSSPRSTRCSARRCSKTASRRASGRPARGGRRGVSPPTQRSGPACRTMLVKYVRREALARRPASSPPPRNAAARQAPGRAARDRQPSRRPSLPHAYIWYEDGPKAPVTHVLKRGDPTSPAVGSSPGCPPCWLARQPDAARRPTARSTGRRLWLARWLTSPENPLVARVIVNRVWQFHFGDGLVASPNDFGVMGDAPTHPELLDWLASEFMAARLAAQAAAPADRAVETYQRRRHFDADGARRGRPRAHSLAVAAAPSRGRGRPRLDPGGQRAVEPERGGPGFYPTLPAGVLAGQSRPGEGWGKSDEREQARRSIYIFAKRSLAVPELELLDAPDTTSSLRAADGLDDRPAGAHVPERGVHPRTGAATSPPGWLREAGDRPEGPGRTGVRAGAGPAARRAEETRAASRSSRSKQRQIESETTRSRPLAETRRRRPSKRSAWWS